MDSFFNFFINMWNEIANLLDSVSFKVAGVSIGLFTLFIGFIAIVLIVKVFWKGA